MVDSSSIRVRRHGAGAPRDGEPPEVGLSRGGRTTKVRTGIDGALAKAALPAPGQAADCTQAGALLEGLGPDETVIGDRDCDSNAILDMIAEAGATAVIPPKSSRNEQRGLDREACRERSPVERFIGRNSGGCNAEQDRAQLPVHRAPGHQPVPAPAGRKPVNGVHSRRLEGACPWPKHRELE